LARIAPTIVALLLIGGTAAAFAVTEHLKLERAPITAPRFTRDFSPVCECPSSTARLSLRFRRPETVDASIVDAEGEPVRSLARDLEVPRGVETFVWNGLDDAGELAPDGVYRLRLRLERERRTILVPTPVRLDTVAPRILELEHRPDTISPDGDGRADRLHVLYRSSEKVAARLLVDGVQVVRTLYRGARRAQSVQWLGSLPVPGEEELREPAEAGQYEVTLVLTDRAGNEVREAFPIRVRYIELDAGSYTVAAGGVISFEVDTDARAFSWSLFPKGARDRPILGERETVDPAVSATVPADAVPGRYRLRVEAEGHHDVAVVIVSEPGP
jgi:hypothetical protein